MTEKLIIQVKDINASWVAEMQEKYQNAKLEIIVHEADEGSMDEHLFWKIIGLLDWSKGKDDAILKPAKTYLKQLPVNAIKKFQDILAEKLYALDKKAYAEQIGDYRYGGPHHFSVDSFLYARACVVANAKDFYFNVLEDPIKMPKNFTFEALIHLAGLAYQEKTKKSWDYLPEISYETFSNPKGWEGKTWTKQLLMP